MIWQRRGFSRFVRFILVVMMLLIGLQISAGRDDGRDQAALEVERFKTSRLASAAPVSLLSPYFSVQDGEDTQLYLLNTFADPVEIDVTVLSSLGDVLPLGRFTVEVTSHLALSLRELLEDADPPFAWGSLRVEYFGDPEMLQGWAVLKQASQVMEWPLGSQEEKTSTLLSSFWDTRQFGEQVRPSFIITNKGMAPVTATIIFGQKLKERIRETRVLPGLTSYRFEPPFDHRGLSHGWVRIQTPGSPGALSGLGFLTGDHFLGRLDLDAPSEATTAGRLEALRMPVGFPDNSRGRTMVTLFNDSALATRAELTVLSSSGTELSRTRVRLSPGVITTRDVASLLSAHVAELPEEVRMRITSPGGKVRVQGLSVLPGGDVLDIALFQGAAGHQSGIYPLPSVDDLEVFNTMVNLGTEPSEIAAQIFWRGGTYALPEIILPVGGSYRFTMDELIHQEAPDILGRTIDPDYEAGFFQWTVRRGSHEIIARTEAIPSGGEDAFGFNCSTCCPETSFGGMVPGQISFNIGQSPSFEGVEYISTCTGTLGPFPANFTSFSYSSPISWNGHVVSSIGDTFQYLGFTASGERTQLGQNECFQVPTTFFGNGPVTVDKCRQQHHPGYDPTPGCQQASTGCANCYDCCEKEKEVGKCQCDSTSSPGICKGGVVTTCGKCKELCFGSFALSCQQQITSCTL
jgi:hypothetical protein